MEKTLFSLPEIQQPAEKPTERGKPRVNLPNRGQIEWRPVDLDSWLPEEHEARLVWAWVKGMDLSPLHAAIRAVEGEAGRNAIDPAILVALWLYATLQGVGSARQLARLCQEHLAYLWLCGGVSVNYHTLADFRVDHEAFLDHWLITSIASLRAEGLVSLEQVAQDGKKIRASAGSSSFHRKETLDKHLVQARQQVTTLRKQLDENPQQLTKRQQKARERAARERLERLEKAKQQLEAMEKRAEQTGRAKKDQKAGKERRASETDPEARVMKMANGGFNPAYNAQFCTDMGSNIIVGMQVAQQGNDTGLASPMLDEVHAKHGQMPAEAVADTSYFSVGEVEKASKKGCMPYFAIPEKGQGKIAAICQKQRTRPKWPSAGSGWGRKKPRQS
jgi:transposase